MFGKHTLLVEIQVKCHVQFPEVPLFVYAAKCDLLYLFEQEVYGESGEFVLLIISITSQHTHCCFNADVAGCILVLEVLTVVTIIYLSRITTNFQKTINHCVRYVSILYLVPAIAMRSTDVIDNGMR